jgi:dipeptidyl aminopeptidase/acylaminoacyl peptidase
MIPRFIRQSPAGGIIPWAFLILLLALPQTMASGQTWDRNEVLKAEGYQLPPEAIAEAVLAPRHLNVTLSNPNADKSWFLIQVGDGPPPIADLAKPYHELGGLFVDFAANRNRNLTIRNGAGIRMVSLDGETVYVEKPDGARVSNPTWSPDGESVAYFAHFPDATHIYLADASNGRSRQLTRRPVLATAVTSFEWTEDSQYIGAVLIPDDRAPMPNTAGAPTGPQIKLNNEGENLVPTYASLMATPLDKELLEWHTSGQLVLMEVGSRRTREIGQPAMIRSFDFSPDGTHARVTRTVEPFSYVVPVSRYGSVEEIWDESGMVLATLDEQEISLGVRSNGQQRGGGPGGGDQAGKRDVAWRADGIGLTFLEQEPAPDSADAPEEPPEEEEEESPRSRRMDRVMHWVAPFDSASLSVLFETNQRMSWHRFSPDMSTLFASERSGENTHVYAVVLDVPDEKHTIARYETDDFYANPGSLMTVRGGGGGGFAGFGRGGGGTPGSSGSTILLSADGEFVFLQGTEYDEDPREVGPKAFIDKVSISGEETDRIFEGENDGAYERVLTPLDIDARRFVISRESMTQVPQSYLWEAGNLGRRLTDNQDYTSDLTNAPRRDFMVRRPDGLEFRVRVTLPPSYLGDELLPAMFWFYPREYTDQEDYSETLRTFNKNSFPNFGTRSIQYLVRLGYAVVEPDAPIIGESGAMNDNYVHDLRTNLATVIDSVDAMGIVDRAKLGLGGHSYGAFGTANAMVHTPFFKAGIAGDGNYNRTLTPLTFQSERRIFWDAPQVYTDMSPFLRADDLTGALLMYHGLADQNTGTFPIHSPRMFHALNGLGKDVAMYLYPHEAHGPAAKETLLDLWARWAAWLDKWVMNPDVEEEEEGGLN